MRYCWLIIVVLLACEDRPVKVDLGTDFFPLRTGQEWTYSINKTTYSYLNDPIEESFELNIVVTDSLNSNGITTYSILVSSRNNSTESWQVIASWSARISGNQALQNESNITRVKLTFPVGPATVWDGNLYNNEPPFLKDYGATPEQLLFRIENFNQPKGILKNKNDALNVRKRKLLDYDKISDTDVTMEKLKFGRSTRSKTDFKDTSGNELEVFLGSPDLELLINK